ncbi:MAG: hypothetical protein K2X27_04185 [Candidatus Obscuribacterales bacterium]|nr:hypothetical protein [Candidatus Obscuribacterales bacterium]
MAPETPLSILTQAEQELLSPDLTNPIEYRKSGLSLNHIIGCPLDCSYCVRHIFNNYEMKAPRALLTDEEAVERLVNHQYFQNSITPIQIFNRATDPFLPSVKPHTLRVLELLNKRGLTNHVLVITRWKVEPDDCVILNSFENIRVTVLVTYSGIDNDKIEPVDSSIAVSSLRTLFEHSRRYRCILYWRPIVPGLNDTPEHIERAKQVANFAHATVFTGLFYRDEIADYYRTNGLPEPYDTVARRKILPEELENKILAHFDDLPDSNTPLFRKTSCAVSYAHELPDYNGHYGIRELCDICPTSQLKRCAADWKVPDAKVIAELTNKLGATSEAKITDRAVVVSGLDESRRYYMQHSLGYQIHDAAKPHRFRQHGRAAIGWDEEGEEK